MTNNRKSRRAAKATAQAVLKRIRPNARLISWARLRTVEPELVEKFDTSIAAAGYRREDVLLYQYDGLYAVMYPPEFSR